MDVKYILRALLVVLLGLDASCTRHRAKSNGGGLIDGGGGTLMYATRDEVISATDKAWGALTMARPDNPLIEGQRWLEVSNEHPRIYAMLKKITSIETTEPADYHSDSKDPNSPLLTSDTASLKALRAKKIHFQEKGPCVGPWHPHSAASVSKLNMSGKICVSITELEAAPTASLYEDILALLVHEIAHLNGYDEKHAQKIQRFYLRNMTAILGLDGENTREIILGKIHDLVFSWDDLVRYNNLDQDYMNNVFGMWRYSFELIGSEVDDPYANAHDVQVAQPELYSKIHDNLERLSHSGLLYDWSQKWWFASTVSVDAGVLADIRATCLLGVEIERELLTYYYGSPDNLDRYPIVFKNEPSWLSKQDSEIRQYTDPATLTNSGLRLAPDRPEHFARGLPIY